MQTRWETSRRPLFIKTVWANGYHHPVLFNGDSTIDEYKSTNKERRTKSAFVQNNWNTPRKACAENSSENKCLKISTIRLLLAGIRSFKEAKHCHTPSSHTPDDSYTIDVTPKQSVKLKNLNNEVSFNPPKPTAKRSKFYSKSCSFDVNDNSDYHNHNKVHHQKIQCNCNEQVVNNTLSERVMVWLDLAAQNTDDKNCNNKSNNQKNNKKRGTTAHVYTDIQKKVNNNNNINNNNKLKPERNVTKRISFDEAQTFNDYKTMVSADQSILRGVKYDNQTANNKMKHKFNKIEEIATSLNKLDDDIDKDKIKIHHDTRRHIHIFMPDIPKKIDCDSSLSCKSSSLIRRPVR